MQTPALPLQPDRRQFLAGAGVAVIGMAVPLASSAPPVELWRPSPVELPATPDLSKPRLFPRAMAALEAHGGRVIHRDIVGIVDFAEASRVPRFHLVDLAGGNVTTHLVAHGSGSDPDRSGWVQRLSNQPDSNASSRGAFLTSEAYIGKHGRSRRLEGLDPDNSMAESRGIVIHAASYVSQAMASEQGRIGRSQGCFAVADGVIGEVLDRLGPGRLILAWK
jgi:hypothetical protein